MQRSASKCAQRPQPDVHETVFGRRKDLSEGKRNTNINSFVIFSSPLLFLFSSSSLCMPPVNAAQSCDTLSHAPLLLSEPSSLASSSSSSSLLSFSPQPSLSPRSTLSPQLTYHLPVHQWYFNGTHNDLNWWGLDYPPLTAYHSLVCGAVAHAINPEWVALDASHGIETPGVRLFMRLTALVADILLFVPAAWLLAKLAGSQVRASEETEAALRREAHQGKGREARKGPGRTTVAPATATATVAATSGAPLARTLTLVALLLQPGAILIDHGHFQFNMIALGLALLAQWAVAKDRDLLGSCLFVLSLNYKQMTLYYAPVFFFGLLGKAINTSANLWAAALRVALIGAVVVSTFALCWLPFITSLEQAAQGEGRR